MVSLLQDSEVNLQAMLSILDPETIFGIIFSWATISALLVFPAAYSLGQFENGTAYYPVLIGIQIAAILALSRFFPGIYAGPASGYYKIVIAGHLATILLAVLLSLGAYFTMYCLRCDYKFQRFLAAFCALILVLKVAFYSQ